MNKILYDLLRLNNNERYIQFYRLYLFGEIHQWMSSYQNLNDIATLGKISNITSFIHTTSKKHAC